MIKEKASNAYALVRNHLQNLSDLRRVIQGTYSIFLFKNLQNHKFLRRDCASRFEFKLFHLSITQDDLVDTLKFINPGEA
jgi:hypothetical protein